MPTIINIHGPMAAGKSTLTRLMRENFKTYAYVDRPNIKKGLDPLGKPISRALSKDAVYFIVKQFMKQGYNIILEEINPESLKKKLRYYFKKYHYTLHSFYVHCSVEEAMKRDVQRSNKNRSERVKEIHAQMKGPTSLDIFFDTEKMNIDECMNLMMKKIQK